MQSTTIYTSNSIGYFIIANKMQVAKVVDYSTQYEHAIGGHGRYMVVHGENDSNIQRFGYDSIALERMKRE